MADQIFQSQVLLFMQKSEANAEAAQKIMSDGLEELKAANLDQGLRLTQVIVAAEVAQAEAAKDREQMKVRFEELEEKIAASPRNSIRGSPHGSVLSSRASVRSSGSRISMDLSSLRHH